MKEDNTGHEIKIFKTRILKPNRPKAQVRHFQIFSFFFLNIDRNNSTAITKSKETLLAKLGKGIA